MKDRDRLLDGNSTELERLLLSAVAQERPSGALQRRMRAGLGLAGSVVTFKAALAAASVAAIAVAATVGISADAPRPGPVLPAAPTAPALAKPMAPTIALPQAPTAPVDAGALNPPPPLQVPARPAAAPRVPAAAQPSAGDIREQMQLLEQARASLRSGDEPGALARLSEYQQRYPRGIFGQEASVLRIEALHRSGDGARARALAEAFVRRHPASPHVERLSGIVGSGKTER